MNYFWVYVREYDSVYEPAEGGYYVETSEVTYKQQYLDIKSVLDDYSDKVNLAYNENWDDIEEKRDRLIFINEDGFLITPITHVGRKRYIGNGFTIGITTEEPQDEPYEGYR